ncbi:MAG TPA: hypothetical protein DD727_02825 [Clostridiales bacterium]|nr:hypothetical protein [Clostridiales bacterium]
MTSIFGLQFEAEYDNVLLSNTQKWGEFAPVHVLLGFLGTTLLAAGNVLQKKGISWMDMIRKRQNGSTGRFFLWITGILLSYILAALPTAFASQFMTPQAISAFAGWGVVMMVALSYLLLNEKLYFTDLIFSILIVAGILVLSLVRKPMNSCVIEARSLFLLFVGPLLVLIINLLIAGNRNRKWKAAVLGGFAGSMTGLAIVLMNILVQENGLSIPALIRSPYLIPYYTCGVLMAISMQLAYKNGDMIVVAPVQNSMIIIYPSICAYVLMQIPVNQVQAAAMGTIVLSCIGILKRR